MSEPAGPDPRTRRRIGYLVAFVVLALYGGMALGLDVPATAGGFKSDESTYYLIGKSLAFDGDLEYRLEDLQRAWAEYPSGPQGVFLKKGQTIRGVRFSASPPFLDVTGTPDPLSGERLYYGKSFIYPAFAAPFVRLFGTNGFLFFNALLLSGVALVAWLFLSARTRPAVAMLAATAFVFVSVTPVYATMIMPELFNFALGVFAYFFWLQKSGREGAPDGRRRFIDGPGSDVLAAAIIGIATFSKVTNALLMGPIVGWLLWKRQWRTAILASVVWTAIVGGLFGINTLSSGDWNYQGGERSTYYRDKGFPFQDAAHGFEVGGEKARNDAQDETLFDPQMFWHNLRANLGYFFIGRFSGILAYFFPGFLAMVVMIATPRRRPGWQWLVLGGVLAQMLVFIISQPYTYFGSGGSIGNRYFMGVYGTTLFLLPQMQRLAGPVLMWTVGGLFMAKLVLNPFYTAVMPYKHAVSGPLRLLPVELTNINDLPTNTNRDQMLFWYGDLGEGDPGFQIYYLDENVYLRELDKSFWVRGDARGEVLIKTDQPFRALELTLRAGPVPAWARVRFGGRSVDVSLPTPGATQRVTFELGEGFLYKFEPDQPPKHIWELAITAGKGFVPKQLDASSADVRYLGVNVTPKILR